MELTTNYQLGKPLKSEMYDEKIFNENADIIDAELHKLELKNQSQDGLLAKKESLNNHINNKDNPHDVTKSQVGLSNVEDKSSETIRDEITFENVINGLGFIPFTPYEVNNLLSTLMTFIEWKDAVETFDDIRITYPEPEEGWTVNVRDDNYNFRFDGEEWVAISDSVILIDNWNRASSHTFNMDNPHGVTKEQIGLNKVENKSSREIMDELTTEDIIKALGYTPSGSTPGIIYSESEPPEAELDTTWIGN